MQAIFVGNTPLKQVTKEITGEYVEIKGEKFYKIANYNQMPPFFMSIVSDSDHWMFISSNGALTAGRKDRENALFPYYTDDKITDSPELTGSKTIVLVQKNDQTLLWEPFSERYANAYAITRNIYKNVYGNKIVFEEINEDLNISFRTSWANSEKFGFIKNSEITNLNSENVQVNILDGVQNLLPYGATYQVQNELSTLLNAYKKNELEGEIGIYSLSSILTDRAEPSEALKATLVWSVGLENSKKLLSSKQLDKFRTGAELVHETDIRASRGAYFLNSELDLAPNTPQNWYIIGEINCDMTDFVAIQKLLKSGKNVAELLETDIQKGTDNLVKIIANADGLQLTNDELSTSRHFANVLFNVMRGGIFDNNYTVEKSDYLDYITNFDKNISQSEAQFLSDLPAEIQYSDLLEKVSTVNNTDLHRLTFEYMPLTFSRRHGDPSRPWNKFSIQTKTEDGAKVLYYQGNWRDIFQNWEALSLSFPSFIESMITKFVNASTADGYNPYRITRHGIDWEVIEPDNPWSNIGYWGDHQIIYLQKLLEVSSKYHPNKLRNFLTNEIFAYANVPYKIKPYAELLKDPQDTIIFDDELEEKISQRVEAKGADGQLVWSKSDEVYKVNLTEKLLVTVLAKLSNFVPEGGIWLNTQRPEWNDANNALVGNGVSMVTLYYMRRYQSFCRDLLANADLQNVTLSSEVAEMLAGITQTFTESKDLLSSSISNVERKNMMDKLGAIGETYRESIYAGFSENTSSVEMSQIIDFFDVTLDFIDHTIKANKRKDNLYHSYNLIKIENDSIAVNYLYEMLEGQVAVLSSGALSVNDTVELMDSLRTSKIYREDQVSYMLYPDRQRPTYVERNNISTENFAKSELLKTMVADNYTKIVTQDSEGMAHFHGTFRNAQDLKTALEALQSTKYAELAEAEMPLLLDIFEEIFDHRSFTGRSGTFYGYEGLGSIYWHMVSKLVLALEENCMQEISDNEQDKLPELIQHYYETRAGVGLGKSPENYGGFPTDPYSHSPGGAGVKQPGMTGQVKEDVISRFGELGLVVENGTIQFNPVLLRKSEFLTESKTFNFYDATGEKQALEIKKDELAFTYCQVPIVYQNSDNQKIKITKKDKTVTEIAGLILDTETSELLFNRTNDVIKIEVELTPNL